MHRRIHFSTYDLDASEFLSQEELAPFAESEDHSLRIEFQLYYGTKETAYCATLVKE